MKLETIEDYEPLKEFVYDFGYKSLRIQYLLFIANYDHLRVEVDDSGAPGLIVVREYEDGYSFLYRDFDFAVEYIENLTAVRDAIFLPALQEELALWIMDNIEGVNHRNPCYMYALTDRDGINGEVKHRIEPLTVDFAEYVRDRWPHGQGGDWSLEYIQRCIEERLSWAIYVDDLPVSFALQHGDGTMGVLHTEPEYRRQGMATSINIEMMNDLTKRGETPYCYILRDNTPSQKLADRLGLTRIDEVSWMSIDLSDE